MNLHCVVAIGLYNARSVDNLGYVEKALVDWCDALRDKTSCEGKTVLCGSVVLSCGFLVKW